MARRLKAMGNARYANGFKLTLHNDLVDLPRRLRAPRVIFVNSMSDLFHEKLPTEFIRQVFDTMQACPQHTFQVLTKRSKRLRELAPELPWPCHIWIGVSVEDKRVLHRIADLRAVPAQVRFLSCEPLIGPHEDLPLDGISWVIVGGESGPGARPMPDDWVRSIRCQCRDAGVHFFFKQWGGVRKHLNGRELDGRTYDEMPPLATKGPRRNLELVVLGSECRRKTVEPLGASRPAWPRCGACGQADQPARRRRCPAPA
jgi:protein gp37